jgi:hypothetical protein
VFNEDIVAISRGRKDSFLIIAVGGKNIKTEVGVLDANDKFYQYTLNSHPYDFILDCDEDEIISGLRVAEICVEYPQLFTDEQKDHIIETLNSLMKHVEMLLLEITLKAEN